MMNRREAIRLLATCAALPLAPGKTLAMLREARALVASPAAPRTLNPHQYDTVKTMAEMILPRTETPGATDVGTSDFIDLILTEWYSDKERVRFLGGIGDVDSRSQSLFGQDFVGCSSIQQADILTALGEKMIEDAPHAERQSRNGDWASRPAESFYPMLRRLTLTAYFTSEAGATEALHFEIIPATHNGCATEQPVKEVSERQ